MEVDVGAQRAEEQARQPADGEEQDAAQHVEHGREQADLPLVHRRQPVEDLDRAGDGGGEGDEAEDRVGERALTADEHVVAPDQEAQQGDGDGADGDEVVAEDVLAAEGADDLGDHAQGGQDHDVDGGVAVEPEEVLVEDWVAADGRVEDAQADDALGEQQQHGDRQHGGGEDLDDGRGVKGPEEQGHSEPGHALGPQHVDAGDEVHAGEDAAEAEDEDAHGGGDDAAGGLAGGVGGVERPAGVEPEGQEVADPHVVELGEGALDHAAEQHPDEEHAAEGVDPEAGEVQAGEGHVLRPEHQRQHEVAEDRRDGGDQEQEDHHAAVEREHVVVEVPRLGGVAAEGGAGREQLGPQQHGEHAAEEEERQHRDHVHQGDALVVEGEEPRQDAALVVQVRVAGRADLGLRVGAVVANARGGRVCGHSRTPLCRTPGKIPCLFQPSSYYLLTSTYHLLATHCGFPSLRGPPTLVEPVALPSEAASCLLSIVSPPPVALLAPATGL